LEQEDRDAISEIPLIHARALLSGELANVLNTFADGAVYMPPNEVPVVGRAAIADKLAELPRLTGYDAPIAEIVGRGDLAVARGTYSLAFQSGSQLTDSGKYVYFLERQQDGTWLVTWAIWNSDLPAQSLDLEPITVRTERR
jgi:ketosteroid isomerase-like protein